MSFYLLSSKIDGFKNPYFKSDGFGRTHRTHTDEAPAASTANDGAAAAMFTGQVAAVF